MPLLYRSARFAIIVAALLTIRPSLAGVTLMVPSNDIPKISAQLDRRDAQEREQAALDRAKQIAEEQDELLPVAHMLAAKEITEQENATDFAVEFVFHLKQAAVEPEQASQCHAYLGKIYFSANQFSKAAVHLAKVAELSPDLRYLYGRSLHGSGKLQQSVEQCELALQELKRLMVEEEPGGTAELYWLNTLQFLERFEEAEEHLIQRLNGDGTAEQRLSEVYRNWSQYFLVRKDYELATAKALLSLSILEDDRSRKNLVQVINSMKRLPRSLRIQYTQRLPDESLGPKTNLMVGSVLCTFEDWEIGVALLNQAARSAPDQPDVLNNLAYFLAKQPTPDLEEALDVADHLVKVAGSNKMFFETRGQIHAQLGNWDKAKEDLLVAQVVMDAHPELHQTLAIAYKRLNDPIRARMHETRYRQLINLQRSSDD